MTTLIIQTVPSLVGIRFLVDGQSYVTGSAGRVTIADTFGAHQIVAEGPLQSSSALRIRFDRWIARNVPPDRKVHLPTQDYLEAGYEISRPLHLRFVDEADKGVPNEDVAKVVLNSSTGASHTFSPQSSPVLLAEHPVGAKGGLVARQVHYFVQSVTIGRDDAVYAGQQSFFLSTSQRRTIHLLAFRLRIMVRDALFGFGTGSSVLVTGTNNHAQLFPLEKGETVTTPSLPRGRYRLVAKGSGISLNAPVALSRPQTAKVLLFSYVDIAAVAVAVLLLGTGLALVGYRLRLARPTIEGQPPSN